MQPGWREPPEKLSNNHNVLSHETAIIDLKNDEGFIWGKMIHATKRNKIRKALKSGIKIENKGVEGFKYIYPIISQQHEKLGYRFLPENFYKRIIESNYPKNKAAILLAELNDRIISGVVLVGNKNIMHYWKGTSHPNIPNSGQGELLQWEAIKWAKNIGSRYYDLCVVDKDKLPSIYEFKTGFSRDFVPFYSFVKKSIYYRTVNRIQKCFLRD